MESLTVARVVDVQLINDGVTAMVTINTPDDQTAQIVAPAVMFVMMERAYINVAAIGRPEKIVLPDQSRLLGRIHLRAIDRVVDTQDSLALILDCDSQVEIQLVLAISPVILEGITTELERQQETFWIGGVVEASTR